MSGLGRRAPSSVCAWSASELGTNDKDRFWSQVTSKKQETSNKSALKKATRKERKKEVYTRPLPLTATRYSAKTSWYEVLTSTPERPPATTTQDDGPTWCNLHTHLHTHVMSNENKFPLKKRGRCWWAGRKSEKKYSERPSFSGDVKRLLPYSQVRHEVDSVAYLRDARAYQAGARYRAYQFLRHAAYFPTTP